MEINHTTGVFETPHEAMQREMFEETGLHIVDWYHFATIYGTNWRLNCLTAISSLSGFESKTDEKVDIFNLDEVPFLPLVSNLFWLIPLSMDRSIVGPTLFTASE